MAKGVTFVLVAGGLAIANEAIFAPIEGHGQPWTNLNWRLVPATAIMALIIGGVESIEPGFGAGLGFLVLLSVLVIPFGNSPSPLENLAGIVNPQSKGK